MKKRLRLLLPMFCILLTGCGSKSAGTDMEIVNEATGESTVSEKTEITEAEITEISETKLPADEACKEETDFSYADLQGTEFWFGSGAGAWCTTMTIAEDGSLQGIYYDLDMGDTGEGYPDGTMYYCKFSGKLSELTKTDNLTYTAELENISYENEVGEEKCEEGVRYIYTEAYGLDNVGTLYFYLPGTKKADLSEECLGWISQAMYDNDGNPVEELNFVCLYNQGGGEAFSSYNVIENFLKSFRYYEEREQYYLDALKNLVNQADMTQNACNRFTLWDDALNEEWKLLMGILPADEKEQLRAEEREWIAYKESAVKAAGVQAEGGSLQPMLEYDTGAELTKERVYELKKMLEQKSGIVIEEEASSVEDSVTAIKKSDTATACEAKHITIDLSTAKETYSEGIDVTPLNLQLVSEEQNGIDWAYEWYESKKLSLPMIGENWDHFYDEVYEYQWFGDQLQIYEKETGSCLYVLEYPTDKWYVNGNNAYLKDGIFYGASVINGYAQPGTCFMFAYDLNKNELLWRSADQSYNTMNFVVKGDVIICGYGFTQEEDYLYQINRITGEILDRTKLKKMPDLIVEQDGKLYVHTYSYNYVFEIVSFF